MINAIIYNLFVSDPEVECGRLWADNISVSEKSMFKHHLESDAYNDLCGCG